MFVDSRLFAVQLLNTLVLHLIVEDHSNARIGKSAHFDWIMIM